MIPGEGGVCGEGDNMVWAGGHFYTVTGKTLFESSQLRLICCHSNWLVGYFDDVRLYNSV